ncbi:MAG TPA: aspartyl protease family protein [Methylomirabilota bacterium]|nr:aspartyl protease family protein [Methylomirabilota bacterium]
MRRFLALIGLFSLLPDAVLPAGPAAAEPRLVFGSPSGVAEIPFQLYGNHIYVRGRVGDSDSLWVVLDTGASGASISASKASSLRLPVQSGGTAHGAGGVVESGLVRGATIRIPGLELQDQMLSTLPLDGIALQTGRTMDVIVGHALLSRAVVEIDYAARLLRITDPAKFRPPSNATSLPLTFKQNLPYTKATIEVPGRKPIAGTFVLDAGAATALSLSPDLTEREKVLEAVPKTLRARGGGVGGQVETRVGRIDRLRLGPYAVERPVTTFRLPGPGGISADGTAGNIGGDVLRRFDVTFDYGHQRMWLAPNSALGDPFEADMSGLVTQMLADSTHGMKVLWLQDDSPAAEAGIAAGDVIEAVDGRSIDEATPVGVREMFRKPEKTYQLTVRRGDERREVKLTTRRLI